LATAAMKPVPYEMTAPVVFPWFWGDCCIPVSEMFNSVHAFSFIFQSQNTEACIFILVKGESHGLRFGALNSTSQIIRLGIKLSQLAEVVSEEMRFGFTSVLTK